MAKILVSGQILDQYESKKQPGTVYLTILDMDTHRQFQASFNGHVEEKSMYLPVNLELVGQLGGGGFNQKMFFKIEQLSGVPKASVKS